MLGRVLTILLIAVCVALLFVLGCGVYSRLVLGERVPSVFGYSVLFVSSGSMSPSIDKGDIIIIKPADEYVCGDIITFFPHGSSYSTTHRIVDITDGGEFVTQGDANNVADREGVQKEQVVGKVEIVVGGWCIYLAVFVITSVIIVMCVIPHCLRKKRKEQSEKI